mgnify:CR=1 FL=1
MNKEATYDAEIAPLMQQILEICKRDKIAMLASFSIPNEDDDGLMCTSALLTDEHAPPSEFLEALRIIRPPRPEPLTLTERDKDGNVTSITTIIG